MHPSRASLFCSAVLCVATATCTQANDGLDTSWNGTGSVLMPVPGYNVGGGGAVAGVVQADGRMLLAGGCSSEGEFLNTVCMTRLQPGGLRDYSFGPGETGVFAFPELLGHPAISFARGLVRQGDGRILVTGFTHGDKPDTTTYAAMTRLLANGTLDPSVSAQPVRFEFAHDAPNPQSLATATVLQADGKLVVVGTGNRAGTDPANQDMAVARARMDLSLDPAFNGSGTRLAAFDLGGDADVAYAMAIQPDGRILAAGTALVGPLDADAAVLRLNADGTPDGTFGNVGRASFDFDGHHLQDLFTAIKVDQAGRIWLAGHFQFSGTDVDFIVARLRANGTLDTDFCNGNGYKTVPFDLDSATTAKKTDEAWGLLLQSDGKVVLTGYASNGEANGTGYDFAAARVMPDCSLDPTFGTGGKLHGRFENAMPVSRAMDASFGGSGIVLAGFAANVDTANNNYVKDGQFGVAMIHLDLVFTNGFDAP